MGGPQRPVDAGARRLAAGGTNSAPCSVMVTAGLGARRLAAGGTYSAPCSVMVTAGLSLQLGGPACGCQGAMPQCGCLRFMMLEHKQLRIEDYSHTNNPQTNSRNISQQTLTIIKLSQISQTTLTKLSQSSYKLSLLPSQELSRSSHITLTKL